MSIYSELCSCYSTEADPTVIVLSQATKWQRMSVYSGFYLSQTCSTVSDLFYYKPLGGNVCLSILGFNCPHYDSPVTDLYNKHCSLVNYIVVFASVHNH